MKGWFSVRMTFESRIDGTALSDGIVEESIRVLRAQDEVQALELAEEIARSAEHAYPNEQGQTVSWHLVAVVEVQELFVTEMLDGTEVFSRMYRRDTAGATGGAADDLRET
jgi:hypothetical protein